MAIKPKQIWYCVLVVVGALAFFNVFSWPKDSKAAMILLNKIDDLIFKPATHPTIFALIVGLAIGTFLLPEVWRFVREHMFPAKPHPNWDLSNAIRYLRARSRWGIGRSANTNEHHIIQEDIDEVLRDVAARGHLTIWGRPTQTGAAAIFSRATEVLVPPAEWTAMSLDLTTMEGDAPHGVCARNHGLDQYQWLRVDRKEVYREWPPAPYWRLYLDKTWKSRRTLT